MAEGSQALERRRMEGAVLMDLPYLPHSGSKRQQQIVRFGSVRYGQGGSPGELRESEGLSSARYPALSQRPPRKAEEGYIAPTALYGKGKLLVVDGTDLRYDGKVVGQVAAGEKSFAALNTKIVIFPDKVYLDTEAEELKPLEAKCPVYGGNLSFTTDTLTVAAQTWNDEEGEAGRLELGAGESLTVYTSASVDRSTGAVTTQGGASTEISKVKAGDILLVADKPKEYRVVTGVSASIETGSVVYTVSYMSHAAVLHTYPKLSEIFKVGDAVEISGCSGALEANNKTSIVRSLEERSLTFYENTFTAGTEAGEALVARTVPELEVICECDNRLWGAEGSTIWASALGDPTNFKVYDGLSTDGYAVAVGSDGPFTGCVASGSNVLFFKEDCVHKIIGTNPKNYELYTYQIQGVRRGSEKSLVTINEALFYHGRNGVYIYTGGTPELLTENFGTRRFRDAVAGTDGERYYISMADEATGEWGLWVYDTLRGIWLREDDTHAADFAGLDGALYFLDVGDGQVYSTGRGGEERVAWSATLYPFDETVHNRKGYSRLYLRLELEPGAWLKVEVSADGGPFRQVYLTPDSRAGTMTVPILPTRCDSFTVRLSGRGACVVKSLVREFDTGSEV